MRDDHTVLPGGRLGSPPVGHIEHVPANDQYPDRVQHRPVVVVGRLGDDYRPVLVQGHVPGREPVEKRPHLVVGRRDEAVHRHDCLHDHLGHAVILPLVTARWLVENQTVGSSPASRALSGCSTANRRRNSRYAVGVSPVNCRNSPQNLPTRLPHQSQPTYRPHPLQQRSFENVQHHSRRRPLIKPLSQLLNRTLPNRLNRNWQPQPRRR